MDYKNIFKNIVNNTEAYLIDHNLNAMVLGISGGIDSTITAIICKTISDRTNIRFIGRSLPIMNRQDEFNTSELVGKAFCNDFKIIPLSEAYEGFLNNLGYEEEPKDSHLYSPKELVDAAKAKQTLIANGNIQARLRMTYLYNLAGLNNGVVMDTDNLTEHYLGFWTRHGDEGDVNPLSTLWKTDVYKLAEYLLTLYTEDSDQYKALKASIDLIPTDGLGISNSDLEQIGANSYKDVDEILHELVINSCAEFERRLDCCCEKFTEEVVRKVHDRYLRSQFKRQPSPVRL